MLFWTQHSIARGENTSLDMKANYLQTAASLRPGTANSSIWFSVTYT